MRKFKKLGIVSLSTVLSVGILAPGVGAATYENQQQERVQIQIANTESIIAKTDLINKLKSLFPGRFDFLSDNEFHMSSGHRFPDDGEEIIRYDLHFDKEINGKHIYGSVGFVGEDLKIENFYYQPITTAEALFPPQVTKNEAEEIATDFLTQLEDGQYQVDTVNNYYPGNQTLIEPIRYVFSFVRTENDVPVNDQSIQISVLGNGEIVDFYHQSMVQGKQTYDDITQVLAKTDVLAKVKENLSIDLQYRVEYDYQTGKPYAQLVYQPTNNGLGVHAITGEWQTVDGFSAEFPEVKQLELLTTEPLEPRTTDFTLEEAKAIANELLAIDSDKVKLIIESVDERMDYTGREIISIQYMYEFANGGHGTSLEFDKQTGEIIHYYDVKQDVLRQLGEGTDSDKRISSEKAIEQAIKYLKEYAPSVLHDYAQPLNEVIYDEWAGGYYINFPRLVDGIVVSGDEISVQVGADGSLLGLNIYQQQIDNWPSTENILSEEEALAAFTEKLSLDLRYANNNPYGQYGPYGVNNSDKDNHYNLVYLPLFNENLYSFLDAVSGEWNKPNTIENDQQEEISHPWAANELNYLINAGILELEAGQDFDANAQITKGEALEVIMKSLTPFYQIYYSEQEAAGQSFDNIDMEHPLYQVIERAVDMGILKTDDSAFEVDDLITREELAVWYIRALNLDQVANQSGIYQLDFVDADEIQDKYVGHVALVHSFDILTANNGRFNPDEEVTYAEVAVSIFRLAKEVYERDTQRYYY